MILATWLHATGNVAPQAETGSSTDDRPVAAVRPAAASADCGSREAGGSEELVLFQEIVQAQEKAFAEALAKFPVRNVRALPTAPTLGLDKARGKRIRMADARFGQMLEKIALAHGMTRGEVAAIYRRGQVENLRPTP